MKKVIKYTLSLSKGTLEKAYFNILEEKNSHNKVYYCHCPKNDRRFTIASCNFNYLKEDGFFEEVYVAYLEDGTNTIQNEKRAKQLLTDFIEHRQFKNEETYREQTKINQDSLSSIEKMFAVPTLDFIESIKSQANQCNELLSKCDSIDCIRKLNNWGYSDTEVLIDINDDGLVPLNKAFKKYGFFDDYKICRIQLETFENLGTVLYDFTEKKLYFSVYKDEEEYAIIEDTTLDTLDEDYQNYLDRENSIEERI